MYFYYFYVLICTLNCDYFRNYYLTQNRKKDIRLWYGLLKNWIWKHAAVLKVIAKEVQIVYRLFLVNCYLLHVPRLPSQPASKMGG